MGKKSDSPSKQSEPEANVDPKEETPKDQVQQEETPKDQPKQEETPKGEAEGTGDGESEETQEEETQEGVASPVKADDLPDPDEEGYSAEMDPSVPSSTLAENVTRELKGLGKSPTLDACREEYRNSKQSE